MKSFKILLIFIIIFIPISNLTAEEEIKDKDNNKDVLKIIILPFNNYTESDMQYLSSYIPELLKRYLKVDKRVDVLDVEDIFNNIKRMELSGADFYNLSTANNFLTKMKADFGIIGRYIIHSETIRIDFKIIDISSEKIINGESFEEIIDNRFITMLETFSKESTAWIKDYILKDTFSTIIDEEEDIFEKIMKKVKVSKLGSLLSNKWIFPIVILIIFYILSKLTMLFFDKVLKKFTLKIKTNIGHKIIEKSKRPMKWLIIFVGIKFAIISIDIHSELIDFMNNASSGVIIILMTYILAQSMDLVIKEWGSNLALKIDKRINDDLIPFIENIVRITIISVGILTVLSRFNIDIAPLVASLGIAGFAIGFAVKDSLSNVIGGIMLALDRSIAVGDKVTIDDDTGIIKEVGLRNTKLMTFDNEIIVIPNGDLANKKFKNFVLPNTMIRVVVNFGIAYGSDIDKAEEVVLNAIQKIEDINDDPEPVVVFNEMADFSLNMQAKFWVNDYMNQYVKKLEATKVIYNALNEAGISIPFPTHTLYIEKDENK